MSEVKSKRRMRTAGSSATGVLALLLVVCLVECASEQRIINSGSKTANLVAKNNGWRATRGGSCLSYGHSCWGAHGKRSAKPPATAPDWFIAKYINNMDTTDNGLVNNRGHSQRLKNEDSNAIYPLDIRDYSPNADRLDSDHDDVPLELAFNRRPASKPMLDEDFMNKLKLWQIMRAASEE